MLREGSGVHRSRMFEIEPIGLVHAARAVPDDDDWGNTEAVIELAERFGADSVAGLETFSHVEVIYVFDRVAPERVVTGARHPRNNATWPAVGIFAQRGKARPNRLGIAVARLVKVDGRRIHVAELDAIDGTPVIDIKPVMREFLPRGELRQPTWATELMARYWRVA
jgi:tRNA (adenine37-N6)-methyltransferase